MNYHVVNQFVADAYSHLLLNCEEGESALAYLKERGFTDETIQRFGLGRSLRQNGLTELLKSHYPENKSDFIEMGLLLEKENGECKDFFSGRVMIPIHDHLGKIVAFAGRVLPNNTHPAKYINTPENKVFRKREHLYNLHNAKAGIVKKNFALIEEGYFDVMASEQHGIDNVVGTMGTALTVENVQKLASLTNRAILIFDGDKAGLAAAKRNAELLMEHGMDVRVAVLPNDIDPCDFLMSFGVEAFSVEVIAKARTYFDFVLEYAKVEKDLNTEAGQMQYINEVFGILRFAPVEKQRDYLVALANEFQINLQHIRFHIERMYMYEA